MKKYEYRKHLRNPIKLMIGMLAFILSIFIYCSIITLIQSSESERIGKLIFLVIGLVGILVIIGTEWVILYFIMFRRFKKINVSIGEEGIIYNNIKGEKVVKYEDIEKLKFSSVKYTGGWAKIKYKGGNIRLTVVLEGIGEFVNELKVRLDENGMSNTYNEKKLYSFYKTATYSDQSWDRFYSNGGKILVLEGMSAVVGILFSLLVNKMQGKVGISVIILVYPIIALVIAEIILAIKLAKNAKVNGYAIKYRDIVLEDKVYKNVYIIVGVITVISIFIIIFI